jgi:bifunctional non-homologous end joining protein LigD
MFPARMASAGEDGEVTRRQGDRLPDPVMPMLATAGKLPAGPHWAFEFKWDGVRAVVAAGAGRIEIFSRNGNDVTGSYPDLDLPSGDRPMLLDGEIVALDARGWPQFGLLQERMHVRRPSDALLRRIPVTYYVFDVLHLDGLSLLDEPYDRRRELLGGLDLTVPRVVVPDCHTDVDGQGLLEVARDNGLEGVVAKRRDSGYEPGRRSSAWIKTALVSTQEVVIGGWRPGEGRRSGGIGALLLGAYDQDGRLAYIGDVGTGFTEAMLRDLLGRLRKLSKADSPFATPVPRDRARHAQWVQPELLGEVEYRTFTGEGRLRHAAWRGLRTDKTPDQARMPAGS